MVGLLPPGMSPLYSMRVRYLPDLSALCVVVVASLWGIGGGLLFSPPWWVGGIFPHPDR